MSNIARLIEEAKNTRGYSEGDLKSLILSMRIALEGCRQEGSDNE